MKTIYLYNLPQSAKDIGAERLLVVATRHNRIENGVKVPTLVHRNKIPATMFFDQGGITPIGNGDYAIAATTRFRNGQYLEEGSAHGCKFRLYNHADPAQATSMSLLVEGGENDLYYANPGVVIETDGQTAKISHITQLNGVHYTSVGGNRDIGRIGVRWMLRRVNDGSLGNLGIAEGGTVDLNVGAGRLNGCIITKSADIPVHPRNRQPEIDDMTGNTADYYWNAADQADPDTETISLQFSYNVKAQLAPLTITLKSLFEA